MARSATKLRFGAGYSYNSKQYGLTVDNVAGYELVVPNGTITSITPDDADLWFALRVSRYPPRVECSQLLTDDPTSQGGLNNFVRCLNLSSPAWLSK